VETDEAVRTLSGMVEKTNRLMAQFKVVHRQVSLRAWILTRWLTRFF
jgi:hypothetical protein